VAPVDPSPRVASGVAVALLAAIRRDVGPVRLPQVGPVAVLAHGAGAPGWRRRGPQAAGHAVLGGPLALVRDRRLQPALVAPVDPSPRVARRVPDALIAAVLRHTGPVRLPQIGPVAVLADPHGSTARSRLKSRLKSGLLSGQCGHTVRVIKVIVVIPIIPILLRIAIFIVNGKAEVVG